MTPEEQAAADAAAAAARQGGTPPRQEIRYVDADVQYLVAKHGSPERVIQKLWRDAGRAREGKRRAEGEAAQWKEKAQLPSDAVVLSGEKKKEYDAFVALGKKPEDITSALQDHATLAERVSKADREALARRTAKALGWKEDATVKVVDREKLPIVMKTEKVDDRDVEVPYVQPKEPGAAAVRLVDYAKDHLDVYMPALTGGTEQGANGPTDSARGTPYLEQETVAGKAPAPDHGGQRGFPMRDKPVLPSERNQTT